MKIAFQTASLTRRAGGLYDATRQLAKGLHSIDDCEVSAFGLEDEAAAQDISGWAPVSTYSLPVVGPRGFGYAPALAGALEAYRPDLLHAHGLWMYPSIVAKRWAQRWRKPHVVSPHGMLDRWALENSRWKKRVAGGLYEGAHLRNAACIHALCRAEADSIREFGLGNPICIVPNGVDIVAEDAASGVPDWAVEWPAGARILLYLGRIHPKKGLRELIQGWHQATARGNAPEEWHLAIAGWDQGGHEGELKALVDALDLAASVHFVGPQFGRDKHLTYRKADAFVLPSFSEGLPMVVLEAWAYGLPVLMTPQCNLPEGFGAQAAIEIAPNAETISKGIEFLFRSSPQARAEIGSRGQQLVRESFSWPTIARKMLAVYRWVLGRAGKPGCVLTT